MAIVASTDPTSPPPLASNANETNVSANTLSIGLAPVEPGRPEDGRAHDSDDEQRPGGNRPTCCRYGAVSRVSVSLDGEQRGLTVSKQEHIGIDAIRGLLAERQYAQRYPRVRGWDREVNRRAVSDLLSAGQRGVAVEDGCEEDGAASGVEIKHFRRVGRQ